jgi:hypothetical protein
MHQSLKKKENVRFKYKLRKTIDLEQISLIVDDGVRKKTPNSVNIDKQSLSIKHQFESRGFYDLHFYIGDNLISTYTFKFK